MGRMNRHEKIREEDLLSSLPPEWPQDLRPMIREQVRAAGSKVVVLDDDPTGTQTVHGICVLTEWSAEALGHEMEGDAPAFYVLTNSRGLPPGEARSMNLEIAGRLKQAFEKSGCPFVVVSRSDSTLRGHFPGEMEALSQGLGADFDGWIVAPFFLEGGRYTIHDTHYVDEGGWLIPAAATAFAGDRIFGYTSSNLREWVGEKTRGRIAPQEVLSISIEDLRDAGPNQVTEHLMDLRGGRVCVVNAASYRDLEVFVLGLLRAEARGRRFLYRTAASFVQVRAGLSPRPLLSARELRQRGSGGGLTLVGSHVPRSTQQLHKLLSLPGMTGIEMDVERILEEGQKRAETEKVLTQTDKTLKMGRHAVVYTSRKVIAGREEENFSIAKRVSEALTCVARGLSTPPRYCVAKGGITASDIATKGLNVKRALVLGQILPGVPVWRLGSESRFPDMPYVVFPGNVGGPSALIDAVKKMIGEETME